MFHAARFAILAALSALTACGSGGRVPPSDPGAVDAASLCVDSACGEAVQLVAIPDAENILFTADGRLFVTGGSDVYEITRDETGDYVATGLAEPTCNFTGMAVNGDVLYASCGNGQLYAGSLSAGPAMEPIHQMDGMCIANGTALGPDGHLYVVDEPLNPTCPTQDPKIIRLTLDPLDPMRVLGQETWVQGSPVGGLPLGLDTTPRFPNGLTVEGNRFYATDGGSVFYADLLPDGSAGPVTPIFYEDTAHDDLSLAGDSLLVTDFFGGRIFQLSLDGELLQETALETFVSPSAVQVAQPPLFKPGDILVTEKGVLTDQDLPLDYLTLWRRVSE